MVDIYTQNWLVVVFDGNKALIYVNTGLESYY